MIVPDYAALGGPLDILQQAVSEQIRSVHIKSALTPDLVVRRPLAKGTPPAPGAPSRGPGFGERVLRFVRPAVVLEHPGGFVTWAPYGLPEKSYYEVGIAATAAIVALAGYGAWRLLEPRRRRS